MARFIAGWTVAYCLLWLCWALAAPIVFGATHKPIAPQHLCPMIQVHHGIGSDLKTYARAIDRCQYER